MAGRWTIVGEVAVGTWPTETAESVDIVVTATTSPRAVPGANDIGPGTHINAVGTYTPQARELDEVVIDTGEGCPGRAGGLIRPNQSGAISERDTYREVAPQLSYLVLDASLASRWWEYVTI